MQVKELYRFPVKSTKAISIDTAEILSTGFKNDRCIAIVDSKNKIVTGRQHPGLVQLVATVEDKELIVSGEKNTCFALPLQGEVAEIKLFGNKVSGRFFSDRANDWISTYLDGDYRFCYHGNEFNKVRSNRGGLSGEFKGYTDSAPLHLINQGTLDYLNLKLKSKVSTGNFRPNIVIAGAEPFEEDKWSVLKINGCTFRVQNLTDRCVFTTIDPKTSKKDLAMQPLATIAKIRIKNEDKPTFGIGLVPLEEGAISVSDSVKVIK